VVDHVIEGSQIVEHRTHECLKFSFVELPIDLMLSHNCNFGRAATPEDESMTGYWSNEQLSYLQFGGGEARKPMILGLTCASAHVENFAALSEFTQGFPEVSETVPSLEAA